MGLKLENLRRSAWLIVVLTLLSLCFVSTAYGQDEQTPSLTLADVITVVTGNDLLSPGQQMMLTYSITVAVTNGAVTPDEALSLIALSGLDSLTEHHRIGFVVQVLDIIFDALADGTIGIDEADGYLKTAIENHNMAGLAPLLPEKDAVGIHNAISSLAASRGYDEAAIQEILSKVDELMEADVPHGFVLRTVKDLINAGATPDEIIAQLEVLKASFAEEEVSGKKGAGEKSQPEHKQSQGQNNHQNKNPGNDKHENNQNPNQGKTGHQDHGGSCKGGGAKEGNK